MGYDRGDSFPFDFEPNVIPFGSESEGKLSPRSYRIQCERKWKHSFISAYCVKSGCEPYDVDNFSALLTFSSVLGSY